MGIATDSKLPAIKAAYVRLMKTILESPALSLLVRHYVFLLFSALILAAGFVRHKTEWIIPSLFGLVYFAAYLLAGPAALWRYLLLPYLAAWVCLPGFVAFAFRRLKTRVKISQAPH
jgi:hypothetical protein